MEDLNMRGIYRDLMREFVRRGHEVYIVFPFERRIKRKSACYDSAGAHLLGVSTLNIQKTNFIEKGIGTLLLDRQYDRAIKAFFSDVKFDLVLYSTPPITFNRVIRRIRGECAAVSYLLLKDIFPQNAVDLGLFSRKSLLYKIYRKKEKELYAISDHIGCMSPANAEYILRHNPEIDPGRVEICPNSIEPVELKGVFREEIKRQNGISPDKVMCIYGGNLGKPQGVDFLIRTIESNESRRNCYFLIIGSGTEYGKLRAWFDEYKPQNARLLSALPKKEYDRLIQAADIGLIYLDRRFTIPNYPSRLLSYLESNIPVMMATDLNTDIGRIAEKNGYGFWAESGNLKEFDTKLDRLLEDPKLRSDMGSRGYEFLLQNYTVNISSDIILSHFAK